MVDVSREAELWWKKRVFGRKGHNGPEKTTLATCHMTTPQKKKKKIESKVSANRLQFVGSFSIRKIHKLDRK